MGFQISVMKNSIPNLIREREFEIGILENGGKREFPLTPSACLDMYQTKLGDVLYNDQRGKKSEDLIREEE